MGKQKTIDLVSEFYNLELGIHFDHIKDLGYAKVYTSDFITDEFNNHAEVYSLQGDTSEKISKIERYLLERDRSPAIYTTKFSKPKSVNHILEKNFGYKESFQDAWMIFDNSYELPSWEEMVEVVHVNTEELIKKAGEIIELGYGGGKTVDNPYGDINMKGFIDSTSNALRNPKMKNRIEGYMARKNGKFVAAGFLVHSERVGYLEGIASSQEVRGQGFGKLITHYATKRSRFLSNEITFLATEIGSRNENFYSRLGYKTVQTGICFVKKN